MQKQPHLGPDRLVYLSLADVLPDIRVASYKLTDTLTNGLPGMMME